jgi:hypothetical protein
MFSVIDKPKQETSGSVSFEDMFPEESVSDPNADLIHFDENPTEHPKAKLFDYFVKGAQQRRAFVPDQKYMSKRQMERRQKALSPSPVSKPSYSDKDIEEWINSHRIN